MAKKKTAPLYQAKVMILGRWYEASGSTVSESIANLKPNGVVKGKSILSVESDGKRVERVLTPYATVRLFSPAKITREIALKNTSLMFAV